LSADQRLKKADKILDSIRMGLQRAIALHEMWARCADKRDILDRMDRSIEGFGFGVVRDAIHRDLVITLLTVVLPGQDTSACIPALLDIVEDSSVVNLMKERSTQPKRVEERIKSAKVKSDSLVKSREVGTLRTVRNKLIAHIVYDNVAHGAKYGDERKVLEQAIPIFEDLALAIKDRDFGLKAKPNQWRRHADAFWTHIASPR